MAQFYRSRSYALINVPVPKLSHLLNFPTPPDSAASRADASSCPLLQHFPAVALPVRLLADYKSGVVVVVHVNKRPG